jgi:hypothetical protein
MSRLGRYESTLLRLMLCIGLLFTVLIPVEAGVFAQDGSAPLWIVRSLPTTEYGVSEPSGLAFSSVANTLLLLDGGGNITLITMSEESTGTRAMPEGAADPLNTAFDDRTGSLFVFNRGQSELAKIKADGNGLPDSSAGSTRLAVKGLDVRDAQGIAFNPGDGRLFVLDAGNAQIVSAASDPTLGFDTKSIQRISLKKLGADTFKGLAYNPNNGHLYVSDPGQKKLYELTLNGDLVSSFDLAALGISNPSAMTFAPSADNTDEADIHNLFMLDERAKEQDASSSSQIVELSFTAPAALPAGTPLLPATLVRIIDTSNAAWNPSAPDPAGIDYWPSRGALLISDSEVDEMKPYWAGKNVFLSSTSGALVGTCSTIAFTGEPTGVAINPNNNHIFFAADYQDMLFEVSLGPDGQYCTADDTRTATSLGAAYGVSDAEDVAYGNNTIFIAGGSAAEIYRIPLGANGVLGGGDDGAMTHWDTASLGFSDLEGIGFNHSAGTLFIVSTKRTDKYLGEMTTSGTLLRAYDLSFMGDLGNIRSDVTYAPGSRNAAVKSIYIASRGIDNDENRNENDGKIWEISIGSSPPGPIPTPTRTPSGSLPGPASLVSPSGTISDTTPTYTWNRVSSASWYYLLVNGPSGNVIKQWYQASAVCSNNTCSLTPAKNLSSGAHSWWIRTWNSDGYGPWSRGLNFNVSTTTAPGVASLVSPSGTISDTTPTYTWNRVSAATWYYLWVNGPSGNVIKQWYQASAVCSNSTCSLTPATTLRSGAHTWWIQTWNAGGYGRWSSGKNFTVSP